MKQDQKAQLLKLGATLEKGEEHKIVVKAPSGDSMFFRAGGLQVIPSESEELDTGGSCVLIINAQAGLLSGVIIRCLRVLGLEAGRERAKKVVKEMAERLVRDRGQAVGAWEGQAAKDLVTIAINWSEKLGKKTGQRPRNLGKKCQRTLSRGSQSRNKLCRIGEWPSLWQPVRCARRKTLS